jgi:hypothetical protein
MTFNEDLLPGVRPAKARERGCQPMGRICDVQLEVQPDHTHRDDCVRTTNLIKVRQTHSVDIDWSG